jgi:hypothetical protein
MNESTWGIPVDDAPASDSLWGIPVDEASEAPVYGMQKPAYLALQDKLSAAGLLESFGSASNYAADKSIRLAPDGNWDAPQMQQLKADDPNDSGFFDAIGDIAGGMLDSIKAGATLAAQASGYRTTDRPGFSHNQVTNEALKQFAQEQNLTPEQVQTAWNDLVALTRKMEPGEQGRALSDGHIIANQKNADWLDDKKAEAMIEAMPTSPERKAEFRARLKDQQIEIAARKLEEFAVMAKGTPMEDPIDWAIKYGKLDEFGTPAFVSEFKKQVVDKAGTGARAAGDVMVGGAKINATVGGLLGGVFNSDTLSNWAADQSETSSLGQGEEARGSGAGRVFEVILHEAPSLLTHVLLTRGAGGIGGAVTKTASGARTTGLVSATLLAGGQSAGLTYSDAIAQGKTREEAEALARRAGVSTSLITGAFMMMGLGGVESTMAGKAAADVTVKDFIKAIALQAGKTGADGAKMAAGKVVYKFTKDLLKGIVGEGLEEGADEWAQAFVNFDPGMNIADAWDGAREAAGIGAMLGGSIDVISKSIQSFPGLERDLAAHGLARTAAAVQPTAVINAGIVPSAATPAPVFTPAPVALPSSSGQSIQLGAKDSTFQSIAEAVFGPPESGKIWFNAPSASGETGVWSLAQDPGNPEQDVIFFQNALAPRSTGRAINRATGQIGPASEASLKRNRPIAAELFQADMKDVPDDAADDDIPGAEPPAAKPSIIEDGGTITAFDRNEQGAFDSARPQIVAELEGLPDGAVVTSGSGPDVITVTKTPKGFVVMKGSAQVGQKPGDAAWASSFANGGKVAFAEEAEAEAAPAEELPAAEPQTPQPDEDEIEGQGQAEGQMPEPVTQESEPASAPEVEAAPEPEPAVEATPPAEAPPANETIEERFARLRRERAAAKGGLKTATTAPVATVATDASVVLSSSDKSKLLTASKKHGKDSGRSVMYSGAEGDLDVTAEVGGLVLGVNKDNKVESAHIVVNREVGKDGRIRYDLAEVTSQVGTSGQFDANTFGSKVFSAISRYTPRRHITEKAEKIAATIVESITAGKGTVSPEVIALTKEMVLAQVGSLVSDEFAAKHVTWTDDPDVTMQVNPSADGTLMIEVNPENVARSLASKYNRIAPSNKVGQYYAVQDFAEYLAQIVYEELVHIASVSEFTDDEMMDLAENLTNQSLSNPRLAKSWLTAINWRRAGFGATPFNSVDEAVRGISFEELVASSHEWMAQFRQRLVSGKTSGSVLADFGYYADNATEGSRGFLQRLREMANRLVRAVKNMLEAHRVANGLPNEIGIMLERLNKVVSEQGFLSPDVQGVGNEASRQQVVTLRGIHKFARAGARVSAAQASVRGVIGRMRAASGDPDLMPVSLVGGRLEPAPGINDAELSEALEVLNDNGRPEFIERLVEAERDLSSLLRLRNLGEPLFGLQRSRRDARDENDRPVTKLVDAVVSNTANLRQQIELAIESEAGMPAADLIAAINGTIFSRDSAVGEIVASIDELEASLLKRASTGDIALSKALTAHQDAKKAFSMMAEPVAPSAGAVDRALSVSRELVDKLTDTSVDPDLSPDELEAALDAIRAEQAVASAAVTEALDQFKKDMAEFSLSREAYLAAEKLVDDRLADVNALLQPILKSTSDTPHIKALQSLVRQIEAKRFDLAMARVNAVSSINGLDGLLDLFMRDPSRAGSLINDSLKDPTAASRTISALASAAGSHDAIARLRNFRAELAYITMGGDTPRSLWAPSTSWSGLDFRHSAKIDLMPVHIGPIAFSGGDMADSANPLIPTTGFLTSFQIDSPYGTMTISSGEGSSYDIAVGMQGGKMKSQPESMMSVVVEAVANDVMSGVDGSFEILGVNPDPFSRASINDIGEKMDSSERNSVMKGNAIAITRKLYESLTEAAWRGHPGVNTQAVNSAGFSLPITAVDTYNRSPFAPELIITPPDLALLADPSGEINFEVGPEENLAKMLDSGFLDDLVSAAAQFVSTMHDVSADQTHPLLSHRDGLTPAGLANSILAPRLVQFLASTKDLVIDGVPLRDRLKKSRGAYDRLLAGIEQASVFAAQAKALAERPTNLTFRAWELYNGVSLVNTIYKSAIRQANDRRDSMRRSASRRAEFPVDPDEMSKIEFEIDVRAQSTQEAARPKDAEFGPLQNSVMISLIRPDEPVELMKQFESISLERAALLRHGVDPENDEAVGNYYATTSADRDTASRMEEGDLTAERVRAEQNREAMQAVSLGRWRARALSALLGGNREHVYSFVNDPRFALGEGYDTDALDNEIMFRLAQGHEEHKQRGLITRFGKNLFDSRGERNTFDGALANLQASHPEAAATIEALRERGGHVQFYASATMPINPAAFHGGDDQASGHVVSAVAMMIRNIAVIDGDVPWTSSQDRGSVVAGDGVARRTGAPAQRELLLRDDRRQDRHKSEEVRGATDKIDNTQLEKMGMQGLVTQETGARIPTVLFIPDKQAPVLAFPYGSAVQVTPEDSVAALEAMLVWLHENGAVDVVKEARRITEAIRGPRNNPDSLAQAIRERLESDYELVGKTITEEEDAKIYLVAARETEKAKRSAIAAARNIGNHPAAPWFDPSVSISMAGRLSPESAAGVIALAMTNNDAKLALSLSMNVMPLGIGPIRPEAVAARGELIDDARFPGYDKFIETEERISRSLADRGKGMENVQFGDEEFDALANEFAEEVVTDGETEEGYQRRMSIVGTPSGTPVMSIRAEWANSLLHSVLDNVNPSWDSADQSNPFVDEKHAKAPRGLGALVGTNRETKLTSFEARQMLAALPDGDLRDWILGDQSDRGGWNGAGIASPSVESLLAMSGEAAERLRSYFLSVVPFTTEWQEDVAAHYKQWSFSQMGGSGQNWYEGRLKKGAFPIAQADGAVEVTNAWGKARLEIAANLPQIKRERQEQGRVVMRKLQKHDAQGRPIFVDKTGREYTGDEVEPVRIEMRIGQDERGRDQWDKAGMITGLPYSRIVGYRLKKTAAHDAAVKGAKLFRQPIQKPATFPTKWTIDENGVYVLTVPGLATGSALSTGEVFRKAQEELFHQVANHGFSHLDIQPVEQEVDSLTWQQTMIRREANKAMREIAEMETSAANAMAEAKVVSDAISELDEVRKDLLAARDMEQFREVLGRGKYLTIAEGHWADAGPLLKSHFDGASELVDAMTNSVIEQFESRSGDLLRSLRLVQAPRVNARVLSRIASPAIQNPRAESARRKADMERLNVLETRLNEARGRYKARQSRQRVAADEWAANSITYQRNPSVKDETAFDAYVAVMNGGKAPHVMTDVQIETSLSQLAKAFGVDALRDRIAATSPGNGLTRTPVIIESKQAAIAAESRRVSKLLSKAEANFKRLHQEAQAARAAGEAAENLATKESANESLFRAVMAMGRARSKFNQVVDAYTTFVGERMGMRLMSTELRMGNNALDSLDDALASIASIQAHATRMSTTTGVRRTAEAAAALEAAEGLATYDPSNGLSSLEFSGVEPNREIQIPDEALPQIVSALISKTMSPDEKRQAIAASIHASVFPFEQQAQALTSILAQRLSDREARVDNTPDTPNALVMDVFRTLSEMESANHAAVQGLSTNTKRQIALSLSRNILQERERHKRGKAERLLSDALREEQKYIRRKQKVFAPRGMDLPSQLRYFGAADDVEALRRDHLWRAQVWEENYTRNIANSSLLDKFAANHVAARTADEQAEIVADTMTILTGEPYHVVDNQIGPVDSKPAAPRAPLKVNADGSANLRTAAHIDPQSKRDASAYMVSLNPILGFHRATSRIGNTAAELGAFDPKASVRSSTELRIASIIAALKGNMLSGSVQVQAEALMREMGSPTISTVRKIDVVANLAEAQIGSNQSAALIESGYLPSRIWTEKEKPFAEGGVFSMLMNHDGAMRKLFAKKFAAIESAEDMIGVLSYGPAGKTGINNHRAQLNEVSKLFNRKMNKIFGGRFKRAFTRASSRPDVLWESSLGYMFFAMRGYIQSGPSGSKVQDRVKTMQKMFLQALDGIEEAILAGLPPTTGATTRTDLLSMSIEKLRQKSSELKAYMTEETYRLLEQRVIVQELEKTFRDPLARMTTGSSFDVDAELLSLQATLPPRSLQWGTFVNETLNYLRESYVEQARLSGVDTKFMEGVTPMAMMWQTFGRTHSTSEQIAPLHERLGLGRAAFMQSPVRNPKHGEMHMLDTNGLTVPLRIAEDMLFRQNVTPAYEAFRATVGTTHIHDGVLAKGTDDYGYIDENASTLLPGKEDQLTDAANAIAHMGQQILRKEMASKGPKHRAMGFVQKLHQLGIVKALNSVSQLYTQTLPAVITYAMVHGGVGKNVGYMALYADYLLHRAMNGLGAPLRALTGTALPDNLASRIDRRVAEIGINVQLRKANGERDYLDDINYVRPSKGMRSRGRLAGRATNILSPVTDTVGRAGSLAMEAGSRMVQTVIGGAEKTIANTIFIDSVVRHINAAREAAGMPAKLTVKEFLEPSFSMEEVTSSVLRRSERDVADMAATADQSKKAGAFQQRETIGAEILRLGAMQLSNHQVHVAGNSMAAYSMIMNGDAQARAVGKRLLASNVIQNVLFRLVKYKVASYLIAQGIGMLTGMDEEEREDLYASFFGIDPKNPDERTMMKWVALTLGGTRPIGWSDSVGGFDESKSNQDLHQITVELGMEVLKQVPYGNIGLVASTAVGGAFGQYAMNKVVDPLIPGSPAHFERAGFTLENTDISDGSGWDNAIYTATSSLMNDLARYSLVMDGVANIVEPLTVISNAPDEVSVRDMGLLLLGGMPFTPRELQQDLNKRFVNKTGAQIWDNQWRR